MISKRIPAVILILLSVSISFVSAYIYSQGNNIVTLTIINRPYYYVENNTSDVDSNLDKGSHANFTAQQYGPDSVYDTLAEEAAAEAIEDYVDNNTSDVDTSGDKGILSDFENMKTKDGMANLTEVASGTTTDLQVPTTCMDQMWSQGALYEWYSAWTPPGSGTVTVTKLWFWDGDGTVGTGETIYMAMYEDGGGYSKLSGSDTVLTGTGSQGWLFADVSTSFEVTLGTTYWIGATCASGGTYNICRDDGANSANYPPNGVGTYYQTNNYVLDSSVPTGASQSINKYIIPGITYTTGTGDYELDQEVQFTNVIDFLPTEKLCIYTGALGNEDLRVDYWNGTGWENLATDLIAYTCNEYAVSLTPANFTIRFRDGITSGDTVQDQWQIDASLLRVEGVGSKEDAVDDDTSDVDSSADLGSLVDFNNMKATDSTYASLTETSGGSSITLINEAEASATTGTSAQVNKPTNTQEDDFMIAILVSTLTSDADGSTMSSAPSGWTLEHDYTQNIFGYSGQHVYIYWKVAGASEPSSYTWTWTDSCGWAAQIATFRGVDTGSPIHAEGSVNQETSLSPMSPSVTTTVDNAMIWTYDMCDGAQIPFTGGAPGGTTWIDRTEITDPGNGLGISTAYFVQASAGATGNQDWTLDANEENSGQQYALKPALTDFRLDQEVQWTNIPYSLPNEVLSIYGGTMDNEDVEVDIWNGTGWETVLTDLTSGWNNVSITDWLTANTFTIRFGDGTKMGDSSPDTWYIDVALVHVWNENFNLDLEVQWTSADYSEANEELCIYYNEASQSNNSHSLDATGGYMVVGDGTPDWGSTAGTISFWGKMDSTVQGRFWGQNGDMETRWSGTNLVLDWGSDTTMTSATSFSADTWYFIAIVWDESSSNLFLYVGDETNAPTLDANSLSGTWASTTPASTENRFMNGLGASEPVDGHGDDLRYWNVARSQAELQSDYNIELTGSETNLRSYFKLNNDFDDIGPDNNDGSGSGSYSFSTDVPFTASSSENLKIDVWNGASWQNVIASLNSGWNNVSVSTYLVSSTFTIRFKGTAETVDAIQDNWEIDATLLHVWT
jgi:hypothetical protein